jgi:hypothetical protein
MNRPHRSDTPRRTRSRHGGDAVLLVDDPGDPRSLSERHVDPRRGGIRDRQLDLRAVRRRVVVLRQEEGPGRLVRGEGIELEQVARGVRRPRGPVRVHRVRTVRAGESLSGCSGPTGHANGDSFDGGHPVGRIDGAADRRPHRTGDRRCEGHREREHGRRDERPHGTSCPVAHFSCSPPTVEPLTSPTERTSR